ncbi:hypothetical protein DL96DRAFT_1742217 [Flagelloscypha sp. PMI_526]|nr:hypothetical protein DL96DRAFT_1742217 [Flagelloscypha sp. PMI_526]
MAAQTSGTWYSIAGGSQSSPLVTSLTAYIPFQTTFAAGVGTDGATTYIVSQVITRLDLFDSNGKPQSTCTAPQTLVGTIVAGVSYQAGTFPITQTATPTQTGTPQIAYTCSYNVPASLGNYVNELRGYDTTQQFTIQGNMVPTATFTPYTLLHQIANPYHPGTNEPQSAAQKRPSGPAPRHAFANLLRHNVNIKPVDLTSSSEHLSPGSSVSPPSSGSQSLFKKERPKSAKTGFDRASSGMDMEMQPPPAYQEAV